jgi:hypothetical protein
MSCGLTSAAASHELRPLCTELSPCVWRPRRLCGKGMRCVPVCGNLSPCVRQVPVCLCTELSVATQEVECKGMRGSVPRHAPGCAARLPGPCVREPSGTWPEGRHLDRVDVQSIGCRERIA